MKTDREKMADRYFTQQKEMDDQLRQEAVETVNAASRALDAVGALKNLQPNQVKSVAAFIREQCERCITALSIGNFYLPEG